jgi:hypothetical protein
MGFHAGWVSWLLVWGATSTRLLHGRPEVWGLPFAILSWSLTCAGFCYVIEMLAMKLEKEGR